MGDAGAPVKAPGEGLVFGVLYSMSDEFVVLALSVSLGFVHGAGVGIGICLNLIQFF